MSQKDPRPSLEDLLRDVQPHANRGAAEPSEARLYIRANFETLVAARDRGISWPQIADVLAQAGVTAADGSRLEWRTVNSLFHAERYARGGRKQRRTKKPATAARPAEPRSTPPDDDQPAPTGQPASRADAKIAAMEANWDARKRKLPKPM